MSVLYLALYCRSIVYIHHNHLQDQTAKQTAEAGQDTIQEHPQNCQEWVDNRDKHEDNAAKRSGKWGEKGQERSWWTLSASCRQLKAGEEELTQAKYGQSSVDGASKSSECLGQVVRERLQRVACTVLELDLTGDEATLICSGADLSGGGVEGGGDGHKLRANVLDGVRFVHLSGLVACNGAVCVGGCALVSVVVSGVMAWWYSETY